MFNGEEDTERELRNLIQEQEQWVLLSLDKERRLNLIELARAVDNLVVRQIADPEWAASPSGEALAHLIAFGLHKALFLTLDESSKFQGAPLYRSIPKLQRWADSVLQHLGRVGYCEHLLELNRVGLSEIKKVGPNKYYVRPASSSTGSEMHEREHFYWVREFISQNQAPLSDSLKASWESIREIMVPRVDTWTTHYIQYTTLPEIDSFYETEGLLKAQLMFGQDSFPQKAKFGGQEFSTGQKMSLTCGLDG